jgi:hypothetical protein
MSTTRPPAATVKGRGHGLGARTPLQHADARGFRRRLGFARAAGRADPAAAPHPVIEEQARSILAGNDSPDIGFDLSINPYRGCEHGCIYCYARPTHSYLNLSPGLDFETRIVAKVNAAEAARGAGAAGLHADAAQHRLGNRRLPAGRAQAAHHPLGDRSAGQVPAPVFADHQVLWSSATST